MPRMDRRYFPSRDRLSVLTAVILLAYALARFLRLPTQQVFGTTFLGSALGVDLSGASLMLLLIAALISTGADTLIRSHPSYQGGITVTHWVVPGATALVLGALLNGVPIGVVWWGGLALSAVMLVAVLITEYLVLVRDDPYHDAAALALTVLTHLLALALFTLLRQLGARAAVSATVGGVVAAALAWRLFDLRGAEFGRSVVYAALIGLFCAEAVWAFNYWRVTPISVGVLMMLVFYVAVGLAQQHLAGKLTRRASLEFALVGLIGIGVAWFWMWR